MTWGELASAVSAGRVPVLSAEIGKRAAAAAAESFWPDRFQAQESLIANIAPVTRDEAMRIPAVHRGVNLISATIGAMPLRPFKDGQPILSGNAANFLAQPERRFPLSYTIAQTVRDLIFDGVAYWFVESRYSTRAPQWVRRYAPWEVSVIRLTDGRAYTAGGRVWREDDVIVFLGPSTDYSHGMDVQPRGLLHAAARTIRTAQRLEEAAARSAWQDVPTWMFTSPDGYELDDDEIEALLSAWEMARRRRTSAYIPPSLTGQALTGPNPEQLQLTEARQYIAAEIARHLNLPPSYVGASSGQSMTYSNLLWDRQDLVDLSLRSWIAPIEDRLTMAADGMTGAQATALGTETRFDTSRFYPEQPETQTQTQTQTPPAEGPVQ